MLITTLEISDYKRVRKIAITPDADRNIILIGGKNGAGKSSTLDALTAAFGGARAIADDPVRHGAEEAAIFVELDDGKGGKLTIDRVIAVDGKTTLEVRDAEGAVRQPQRVLDALIGARFLDPLSFLELPAKTQREQLMKLIPDAARIVDLDAKRGRGFDRRTEIGRDLAKAEGELARLPEVTPGVPLDVASLSNERAAFHAQQHEGAKLASALDTLKQRTSLASATVKARALEISKLKGRIAELQEELSRTEAEMPVVEEELQKTRDLEAKAAAAVTTAAKEWTSTQARRDQLDAELAKADSHNREVYAAESQAKRRVEAAAAIEKLKADRDVCTVAIAAIDARKAEILGAAKLPVDGLELGADGILLGGVPFAQASDAERLRVALALAIAGSPQLGDVWIHDGALLDDDSLELVAKHAAAAGKRIWIERVGTKDPGVIVIQDGTVV